MNAHELIENLQKRPEQPLRFEFDGLQSKPGYHITEIKQASVTSLDCGFKQHHWSELNIQLLDGATGSTELPVTNRKFTQILSTAIDTLSMNDESTRLYVEFSPNNTALRKLTVQSVHETSNSLLIKLVSESAVCKPFQQALEDSRNSIASACCPGVEHTADASVSGCCPSK